MCVNQPVNPVFVLINLLSRARVEIEPIITYKLLGKRREKLSREVINKLETIRGKRPEEEGYVD